MGGDGRDEIFYGRDFMAFGVANKIFIHFWLLNLVKYEYFVIVDHLFFC
jgi:hypothetical protein